MSKPFKPGDRVVWWKQEVAVLEEGCMAGGITQAFYGGVPEPIRQAVYERLDDHLGDLTRKFIEAFGCP